MRLTLSVLRCPANAVNETRSFDGGEISLGRGPDNDWVLSDPERHLSKRHCVLAFHGGSWQVADVSTNGTYLNAGSQPLGQGHPSPLETGDRLRLGDYEMEVRIAAAPAGTTWADPAWQQPREHVAPTWQQEPAWDNGPAAPAAPWRGDPFGQDPFQPPAPAQPAPSAFGGGPADHGMGDRGVADRGIGERGITLPADYDPMAPDFGAEGEQDAWGRHPTQGDHTPALNEAFRPAPMGATLPDDWADDLLADLPGTIPATGPAAPVPAAAPMKPAPVAPAPVAPVPVAPPTPAPRPAAPRAPTPGPAMRDEPMLDDDAFAPAPAVHPAAAPPRSAPAPVPSAFQTAADPFGSDPVPFEPAPAPVPAAPARAVQPPAPAPAGDGALLAALLAGADMGDFKVVDPDATMRQAGAMLRAAIAGLRQVLIARSAVKSEFRIDRTMLSARGNNPLKVSVDDDAALETLLGPKRRSDMPPAHAVADALRDVRLHELATMTAMQSAIRAVVAAFDPAPLLANAGGGLAMQRKARAWDAFEALHEKITQGLTDDFDSVFGKSFARAYEQAQDELSARAQDELSERDHEEEGRR